MDGKNSLNGPKISVIVPVYNVEKYLPKCIQSILNQTYGDFELILIDDGSRDQSGAICDAYQKQDKRIKVLHKMNEGVSIARNCGLEIASGQYFVMCDSDDWLHPQLFEYCVSIMDNSLLDLIIYQYQSVAEDDIKYEKVNLSKDCLQVFDAEQALKEMLLGRKYRMLSCNKFYKRELWRNVRYPAHRKFGDDAAVTYKLLGQCDAIGFLQEKLYFYRQHNQSALHQSLSSNNYQLFDSLDEMIPYFKINYEKLMPLVYQAYALRIFDFLVQAVKQNNKGELIDGIRGYVQKHIKYLLQSNITIKQKILLLILLKSKTMFLLMYTGR